MQCGVDGIWCDILRWFLDHGGKELIEYLSALVGGKPEAVERSKGFLGVAGALGSFSFLVWKWWHFRDSVLHRRLDEYIKESDSRLEPSVRGTVELISRPDRRSNVRQPSYALELRRILERNNWDRAVAYSGAKGAQDRELSRVTARIEERTKLAIDALVSLRQQRAAAETIAAALAGARAATVKDPSWARKFDDEAIRLYRGVLQIEGHKNDIIAAEGVAFHLLRAGKLEHADEAYESLEELAQGLSDPKEQAFITSRAQRYRALILQSRSPGGVARARDMLREKAIPLRDPFVPTMQKWELIEQGGLHYTTGYLASKLTNVQIEAAQLGKASDCFERVLDQVPKQPVVLFSWKRRLRKAAREGLKRVENAQKQKVYDLKWLFQPEAQPAVSAPSNQP